MSENLIPKSNDILPGDISAKTGNAGIFVTGGTGLVGSRLIEQLVKENKRVKALYRSKIPDIEGKEKVEWCKGDILDVVALDEAMKNIHQVYHCAAIISFNSKQKAEMFATNIDGTANVVNAALHAGVKKLCYVSSVAALGKANAEAEVTENMNWNDEADNSNYGKSKHLAEVEVWRGTGEGLQAVIVNPAIILGAGDWHQGSAKIFKTAFNEFPWFTEGVTGFVDVNDVVNAMVQLMENDISGERFILSSGNRTYKEIFTAIATAFHKKPPYKKVTPLIAEAVWRLEKIKSDFTGKDSLLTKETARAAQSIVRYDNSKLTNFLPSFEYTTIDETIKRVCKELAEKYQLVV